MVEIKALLCCSRTANVHDSVAYVCALVKARYAHCELDRVRNAYLVLGRMAHIEMLTGCRHAVFVFSLRSHFRLAVSLLNAGSDHTRVLFDGKPWKLSTEKKNVKFVAVATDDYYDYFKKKSFPMRFVLIGCNCSCANFGSLSFQFKRTFRFAAGCIEWRADITVFSDLWQSAQCWQYGAFIAV